jgi:EmrB/QacA subfamily drug resistance transporter
LTENPTQNKARASSPAQAESPPRFALPILLLGTFVITLDIFIVNVAIPSTQRDLQAGSAAVQFIVAGYALAYAVGLITGGRLGDLFGRRRLFLMGMGLFTLASLGCGLAQTSSELVATRVLQGAASAMLGPQVLAIIGVSYPGAARVKAFSAFGLTVGLAGVTGQLIGGILIQADVAGLGWRSCYLVNVPIGIAALVLAPRWVPESRAAGSSRLDPLGMLVVAAGLVAVVLPLTLGRQQGWPLWTWVLLAVSPVVLGVFAALQRREAARSGSPLVHPALFRQRSFTIGAVIAVVHYSGMVSFFLVLALYLQQGLQLSAMKSGLVFLPLGLGFLATSLTARRWVARLNHQVLAVGSILIAAGLVALWLAVNQIGIDGSPFALFPGLLIDGAGMGLVVAPLTLVALTGADPRYAGAAAGVISAANQVGGALGVAVVGVVFYHALGTQPQPADFAEAFTASMVILLPLTAAVVLLTQLLSRPGRAA